MKTDELTKYAKEAFLAVKISYINAVSLLCDKVGADVTTVAAAMGMDKRIGAYALNAGTGFGGLYSPKDIERLISISEKLGYDFKLLKALRNIHQEQNRIFIEKIKDQLWIIKDKTIGILGIPFKEEAGISGFGFFDIIKRLYSEGAKVKVYEPLAPRKMRHRYVAVSFCKNAYEACRGAECLLILSDCEEFKLLDLKRVKKLLKRPVIIDGRNIYKRSVMDKKGFTYIGIGTSVKKKCICY